MHTDYKEWGQFTKTLTSTHTHNNVGATCTHCKKSYSLGNVEISTKFSTNTVEEDDDDENICNVPDLSSRININPYGAFGYMLQLCCPNCGSKMLFSDVGIGPCITSLISQGLYPNLTFGFCMGTEASIKKNISPEIHLVNTFESIEKLLEVLYEVCETEDIEKFQGTRNIDTIDKPSVSRYIINFSDESVIPLIICADDYSESAIICFDEISTIKKHFYDKEITDTLINKKFLKSIENFVETLYFLSYEDLSWQGIEISPPQKPEEIEGDFDSYINSITFGIEEILSPDTDDNNFTEEDE